MSDSLDSNNAHDDDLRLIEQQIKLEEAKRATLDAAHRNIKQEEQREKNQEERARRKAVAGMSTKAKLLILLAVVAAIIIVAGLIVPSMLPKQENRYYADSDLEKVVDIDELSTVEYVYRGIVEKRGMFDMVDYWVKYEAHVYVVFDMSKIKIHIDNDAKTIEVTLPEPVIKEPVLNENELGYLPERAQGDFPEIISMCQEDAMNEIQADGEIIERAYESLKSTVQALTEPLLDGDYEYSWKYAADEPREGVADDGR